MALMLMTQSPRQCLVMINLNSLRPPGNLTLGPLYLRRLTAVFGNLIFDRTSRTQTCPTSADPVEIAMLVASDESRCEITTCDKNSIFEWKNNGS
jgi:hypothetical protein